MGGTGRLSFSNSKALVYEAQEYNPDSQTRLKRLSIYYNMLSDLQRCSFVNCSSGISVLMLSLHCSLNLNACTRFFLFCAAPEHFGFVRTCTSELVAGLLCPSPGEPGSRGQRRCKFGTKTSTRVSGKQLCKERFCFTGLSVVVLASVCQVKLVVIIKQGKF